MLSNKLIVAIVSFIPPYPLTHGGNRQVIYNLVSWLRDKGYSVVYVYQVAGCGGELRQFLENIVDELVIVGELVECDFQNMFKPRRYVSGGLKICQNMLRVFSPALANKLGSLKPFISVHPLHQRNPKECWPETRKYVKDLAKREKALVVVSEYIYMTQCLIGLPENVLTFTHTHDMLSRVDKEIGAKGIDTQGRGCSSEEERTALLRGKVILALQEEEARQFKALVPEREVMVLGFSPEVIVPKPSDKVVSNTVFTLGGNNPLNRRGLELFASKVWPKVLGEVPDAQLRAAGHASDALPPNTPNAEVLGTLDDLTDEYARAAVVVNPVEVGTGLKIKTVEALCHGKALVTTGAGIEGIPMEEPACLIADDWDEFASYVIRLLKDKALRAATELKAVDYSQKNLTRDAVFRDFERRLEQHFNKYL